MEFDMNKYNDRLDKIDDNLELYHNKYMDSTRFILYLSNNEVIEISYDINSIPHLFGIDTNFLRSTGLYPNSSIEILYDMLDNPNRIASQIQRGHMKEENIFSNYTDEKLDNFKNICGIDISNIEFIAKYEKEKSFALDEEPLEGEYYIGFKTNDTLSVVGFKCNDISSLNGNRIYFPITNLKFDNNNIVEKDAFLKRLLKNQKLLYVQTLRKNTIINGKIKRDKSYYKPEPKINKMSIIDRYADEYGATCDTHKNYLYYVKKNSNLYNEKRQIWDVINNISNFIKDRKMIEFSKLGQEIEEIDESLIDLIGSYNDFLHNDSDDANNYSYADLILELENAKKKIIEKEELINKIDEQNKKLISKNETLESENKDLNDNIEKIRTIVNK